MFEGFGTFDIDCDGVEIHGVRGGQGPPLLLLHGYPQTHAMWHRVAPVLAERFTVVAPDLRGYGRSGKPATTADHAPYSKRAMAADMARLMTRLGHAGFRVCGHDRGARVAHRLGMDHPERVERMVLLDIAPTREMYRDADADFARAYWWWFYLVQPAPLPEEMIGADPKNYWLRKCGSGAAGLAPFAAEALADYLDCFADPATIHATCEDYRAAVTIDIRHDDDDGGRKLQCPLLVLWGEDGVIERCFDALALWRERAVDVRGCSMPGGHYLAEERPEALLQRILPFLEEPLSENEETL